MIPSVDPTGSHPLCWRVAVTRAWLTTLCRALARTLLRPRRALPAAALALALGGTPLIQAAPSATITVAVGASGQTAGDGCSLVEAILNANADNQSGSTECAAGSGADTIVLPTNALLTYTQSFGGSGQQNALPVISSAITIEGNGSTLQRAATASTGFRLLTVSGSGATLTLRQATVRGGFRPDGAGGLWIDNDATATIESSTFTDNGAGLIAGAISNEGTLTMTNSTLSGNTAGETGGGGLSNTGSATISNSTITNNGGTFSGGGILNGASVPGVYCQPPASQTAPSVGPTGGATLILTNTIVSGNQADHGAEICNNGGVVTSGGNVIGYSGSARSQGFTPAPSDIVPSVSLAAILNPTLANNGGPTPTHALVWLSPAIDALDNGPETDQRGVARPQDGDGNGDAKFDVGAVEFGSEVLNNAVFLPLVAH